MAYIGNFPTSTGFTTANFKTTNLTKRTETASGRIIRGTNATTLFQCTLQFPSVSLAEWKPVQAFIAQCQGSLNEFDVVLPTISTSTTDYPSATISVGTTTAAGSTTVDIDTNVISATALKAGDVVRFSGHTKVYMVTSDINTDGTGGATLNIQPALTTGVTSGDTVTFNNVPFRVILSNDVQEFDYRTDGLVDYELDVQEVL
jgi:hypothetical protein